MFTERGELRVMEFQSAAGRCVRRSSSREAKVEGLDQSQFAGCGRATGPGSQHAHVHSRESVVMPATLTW